MKALLLYPDRDFDPQQQLPENEEILTQDLELNLLFNALSRGDRFIFDVVKKIILSSSEDIELIQYRQDIVKDCLKNPAIVREIYQITIEAHENKKKDWLGVFSNNPTGILSDAIKMMQMFLDLLERLKDIADAHADKFESKGFSLFFTMIKKELNDDYFAIVQQHLRYLKFSNGVLFSAGLGKGNEGVNYVLRKSPERQTWMKRIFSQRQTAYTFSVDSRDDSGTRTLSQLKNRVVNLAADALAQSAYHIEDFFKMLRTEMAFYIGCLNLYELLAQTEEIVSFPVPVDSSERRHSFQGLYDIGLALTVKRKVVSNDVNADKNDLVMITGANQGGKSTFLRSIGVAQLMMQCGMFVPAAFFCANTCSGLFTHFKRKEDETMTSGKLDEELNRMSAIVDRVASNSLVLFNESFAATNEREGSEIARQIIQALLDENIKVFYVTHLYELARSFYNTKMKNAIFLRAERKAGGKRTFKLVESEPLQTSHGEDVYRQVFGESSEKLS